MIRFLLGGDGWVYSKSSDDTGQRDTLFLPPERTEAEIMAAEARWAVESPIVDALLHANGSAMAVLDEHRQIVALNARYLEVLGAHDVSRVLGMRPGEAIDCSFVDQAPSGCGTGQACASCGAALAIMVAQHQGRAEERDCVIHVDRAGQESDHVFRARVAPLHVDDRRWLIFTLDDVSAARRQETLERAFLHDLGNLATGLLGASELLGGDASEDASLISDIKILSGQLSREIQVQRVLCRAHPDMYRAAPQQVNVATALRMLQSTLENNPAAKDRTLSVELPPGELNVVTDLTLLERVLREMTLNALEATPAGGTVRLTAVVDAAGCKFRVWNAGTISAAIAPRIFQRYFTTKEGTGRGQGTFAMRLFGEEYLGGQVSFTSTPEQGTWFELALPSRAILS